MGLAKREYGTITVVDPGSDRPLLQASTLQCCHCGGHWWPQPGSGNLRGFCTSCMGPVCGPGCSACVPTEQLLENMEKGRDWTFRPIIVPAGWDAE